MPHVLRIPADATVSTIARAISGVRAQRIALLVAPGAGTDLADPVALQLLRTLCDELGKDVAVIGGNERLRAAAVAVGFAAAISLDDWKTDPELPAVRPTAGGAQPSEQRTRGRLYRRRKQPQQPQQWEGVHALPDDGGVWDEDEVDYWEDELPAYVQALMQTEGSFPGLHDETPAERARRPRITRPLRELSEDEALRLADESHEERMTLTIRDTAGHAAVHSSTGERGHGGSGHAEPPAP
jgi:hypothetical protein